MPNIEPFEKYTDRYDLWFEKNKKIFQAELNAIRMLMPNVTPEKSIEIGVGTGRFAEALGIKIGIEPSINMGLKAKKKKIKVINATAEQLPFPSKYFDLALMVTTICFLDNPSKAFNEINRILTNSGIIIIGFVDKETELGKQYLKKKHSNVFYKTATFYSTIEITKMLQNSRFSNFSYKQTIIPNTPVYSIKDGFRIGGFTVIKAKKMNI